MFNLQDTFNKELPADPNRNNTRRQVMESCFSYVTPRVPSDPKLIHVSDDMLMSLGLSQEDANSSSFLNTFSGTSVLKDSDPYAMCYGGHQFGQWAGQLGDGRAINLGEVVHNNERWALQLKGAGETPYSRSADGLAVLRSSIREHLCSEAMYHLGIPTTRSLSLMLSGDEVLRDVMYDGNPAYEKGAIVCRVAPSFIRFGNFQIFSARQDYSNLKILVNYTIRHFFPNIKEGSKAGYIQFFDKVAELTLDMILEWQRVGFVHGVMNTDNLSILGLTIDYGPYGWLEGYDHGWTPNTTDRQHKRYQYGNQPGIGLWNLAQLGNALYPIIEEAQPLEDVLENYKKQFVLRHLNMMRNKLGLQEKRKEDYDLIKSLEQQLQVTETDMTIFFRNLSDIKKDTSIQDDDRTLKPISNAFYRFDELSDGTIDSWKSWLESYRERLLLETQTDEDRKKAMNKVNPKYVLRNYMAQLAIDKANQGDYALIDELYNLLKRPYDEQSESEKWFSRRPEWARHKVGCSMLSCSS